MYKNENVTPSSTLDVNVHLQINITDALQSISNTLATLFFMSKKEQKEEQPKQIEESKNKEMLRY